MRITHLFYAGLLFFISCTTNHNNKAAAPINTFDSTAAKKEIPAFFPVTTFIKGQLFEIKTGGVNPIKFTTIKDHTDSAWLKMEDVDTEFADFLSPEIDSSNLVSLFTEKKFFDQTVNAITLTYDPISILADTFSLRHWDIYIDPASGLVKRIYFLKEYPGKKMKQLMWTTGKNCTITSIAEDANGKAFVEKKVLIKWDF